MVKKTKNSCYSIMMMMIIVKQQIGFINFIEFRISATEFHYHIHSDQIRSEKCIFSFLSILTDMDNRFCFLLCENHWSLLYIVFFHFIRNTCRIQHEKEIHFFISYQYYEPLCCGHFLFDHF